MRGLKELSVICILYVLFQATNAQRRVDRCRYQRRSEDVTECINNRQTMTVKLVRGDVNTCAPTSTRLRRCRVRKIKGCVYTKPVVGECDAFTKKQTITRDLIDDQSDPSCAAKKTKTKRCKAVANTRRQRQEQEKRAEKKAVRESAKEEVRLQKKEETKRKRVEEKKKNRLRAEARIMKQQAQKLYGFYTCQYVRGRTTDCENGMSTRVDTLVPGGSRNCQETRAVELPCDPDALIQSI